MIRQMNWIERSFTFNMPSGAFPSVLERFRGTPARIEEMVAGQPGDVLVRKPDQGWSIQEQIGHLADLEELNETRLSEFLAGRPELTPADMKNVKTEEADHQEVSLDALLTRFRGLRADLVDQLEPLTQSQIEISAHHGRLNVQMRIIDWVYFMSEHDDHHLAKIRELLHAFGN